ncbi:MAG: TIGR00341 family protein [Halobacteriaceae archaeon]
MRLVQVSVPTGKREVVLDALDGEDIDYVVTDETSGREFTAVVYFPLPPEAVESVLDALQDAGLSEDAYTVVIEAETVVSKRFERLREQYAEDEESEERVARQELLARAEELSPQSRSYFALTVISAVVATAGILLDSPAVVVGSMVIAPLIGPAMAASVGTVLDEPDLFRRGVRLQVTGGLAAVIAAAAFAALSRGALVVPPGTDVAAIEQLSGRTAPGFLSLAVALGAGVAGALSLSSPVSTALVGVAIAVALVPPIGVIGIGVAWGRPVMAAGALLLVMVNLVSINFAALATLWYQGYRPGSWFRFEGTRAATLRRLGALATVLLVLSAVLGGLTFYTVQNAAFESESRAAVAATVGTEPYAQATLRRVEFRYGGRLPVPRPNAVVVTVAGDPAANQGLARAIRAAISDRTGRRLHVEVVFVDVQEAGSTRRARFPRAAPPAADPVAA